MTSIWLLVVAAAGEHLLLVATAHAEHRTGGVYDRPMLVRAGVDDLGITLGNVLECAQKKTAVEVIVSGNALTAILADWSGRIRLNFHVSRQSAYMTSMVFPSKQVYRDFYVKRLLAPLLASGCPGQPKNRP